MSFCPRRARYAATLLLTDPYSAPIGEDFLRYLDAKGGLTIEDALGIKPGAGGDPWWQTESREEMYAALCRAADMIAPGASVSTAADRLRQVIVRYRSTSWHRDQALDEIPARYAGRPESEMCFAFHAAGGFVPESSSRLRWILSVWRSENLPACETGDFHRQDLMASSSSAKEIPQC
jgi:hypothetical protein